jgi:oligopeptide transport system permease protein
MHSATASHPSAWSVIRQHRPALISFIGLVIIVIAAIIGPAVMPEELKHPSPSVFLEPMSRGQSGHIHLCGTDLSGQDLCYRLLSGARVSLGIGIAGALVSLGIGILYGMISGFVGGAVDGFMMRLIDVLYSVPRVLFIMIFIAALDGQFKDSLDAARLYCQSQDWPQLTSLMSDLLPYSRLLVMVLALGLIEWLTMARIIRGQVLVLRETAFVVAAQSMGQGLWAILWKHLLPNLSSVILTYLTLTIPAVILDESFLSFLGLGIEDPAASWGSLLKDGAQVINPLHSKWWLLAFPAGLMSASLLALNFLGDGLRDVFDPKK